MERPTGGVVGSVDIACLSEGGCPHWEVDVGYSACQEVVVILEFVDRGQEIVGSVIGSVCCSAERRRLLKRRDGQCRVVGKAAANGVVVRAPADGLAAKLGPRSGPSLAENRTTKLEVVDVYLEGRVHVPGVRRHVIYSKA